MSTKFISQLEDIERDLEALAGAEGTRIVEWTFQSSAWRILKNIRKPESTGGWPIMTRTSWKKWGFERLKSNSGKVTFQIYNDATLNEQRAARGAKPLSKKGQYAYAGWVYAKGDARNRQPIAPGIIKRAIIATRPTIQKNFYLRLERLLNKKRG